ncbi:Glutathione S-transferase family protein [Minicystis rosea]|nr:Glutathione S-transferase family protein [Minicystis rosea]
MDAPVEGWHDRSMADPLLVTITFSHYCEKARWALDRAGIAYRESGHLPFFHIMAVRRAGGARTTPLLVTEDGVLADSSDIVRWADRRRPAANLFGKTHEDRNEVLRLEDDFDEKLGPHTRRWAYASCLSDRDLLVSLFEAQRETPSFQRRALAAGFPVARAVLRRTLGIDDAGAARSEAKIDAVFGTVADLLSDGRPYLVGDTLTAADLTFASLAAPVIFPEEQRTRLPRFEALPAAARSRVEAWRAHPAGAFARRMIRDHRHV